ncbi:MAG: glucose-6-phosphate dehydrogenase assembly protein OpcA [Dehalococcoidia bacterium]
MVTTDLVHENGTLDLDSATVERALSELWQEAAKDSDGAPVTRARVMTAIIYTEDEESAGFAAAVAEALPERHPSRGILLHVNPRERRPLSASISIQCLINPGGERKLCSEQIVVTAGEDTRALLPGAVMPLVVADLPAVLWWTGRPRPADPVLRRFARSAADRVVLDSGLFRDPAAGLISLARWRDDARRHAALGDLAWERLREWRQLLAQTMDPPEARAGLTQVRDVTVTYRGEAVMPAEPLLLAGWLAASLRWRPIDSPAPGVVTLGAGTETVTLRFLQALEQPAVAGIGSMRLATVDGVSYTVRVDDQAAGVCDVEGFGRAPLGRVVPMRPDEPLELVVRALGRRGQDPIYESALGAAAEIVVLGVTA